MREKESPRRSRTQSRASRRLAGMVSFAGVASIALMFLASASASAVTPSSTTQKAPYNATSVAATAAGTSGCGRERQTSPIGFNTANGLAHAAETGQSSSCPASLGGPSTFSSAWVSNEVSIYWPVSIGSSGTHSISFNATDAEKASVRVHTSGLCPSQTTSYSWGNLTTGSCGVYADANWNGFWFAYDATNGSTFGGTGPSTGYVNSTPVFVEKFRTVDWGCYNANYGGTCFSYNSSVSTPMSSVTAVYSAITADYFVNGTFNSSHTYYLVWQGITEITTYAYGFSSAIAYSDLNIAFHGYGVKFNSITVS